MADEKCFYCERPAEYLCDFVLEAAAVHLVTCDRPLCANHRVHRGNKFFCRRSGRGKGCEVVTVDYCPGHAQGPDHKPPYNPIGGPKAG